MPIEGLSEIYRPPGVGVIRLGEKTVTKGKEHPKPLPYFLVPDEIKPIVGEKPTELDVLLPSSRIEEAFPQYYERWGGSRDTSKSVLLCQGDGKTATQRTAEGQMEKVLCLGQDCPMQTCRPKKCRRVCRLMVILPNVPGLGVWQINTGSWNGTVDVNSMVKTLNQMFGRATGIPLKLILTSKQVAPDGVPKTIFFIELVCPSLSYNDAIRALERVPMRELAAPKAIVERPDDLVPVSSRSEGGIPEDVVESDDGEDGMAGVTAERTGPKPVIPEREVAPTAAAKPRKPLPF